MASGASLVSPTLVSRTVEFSYIYILSVVWIPCNCAPHTDIIALDYLPTMSSVGKEGEERHLGEVTGA